MFSCFLSTLFHSCLAQFLSTTSAGTPQLLLKPSSHRDPDHCKHKLVFIWQLHDILDILMDTDGLEMGINEVTEEKWGLCQTRPRLTQLFSRYFLEWDWFTFSMQSPVYTNTSQNHHHKCDWLMNCRKSKGLKRHKNTAESWAST